MFGSLKTAVRVSAAISDVVSGDSSGMSNARLENERESHRIAVPLSVRETPDRAEEPVEANEPLSVVVSGTK